MSGAAIGHEDDPRWVVGMIGARRNYSVQRSLHARGRLARFYTDLWFRRGLPFASRLGGSFARLATRRHDRLLDADVVSFRSRMLFDELRFRWSGSSDLARHWVEQGRLFGRLAIAHLRRHPVRGGASAFMGFNTTSLELHQHFRGLGMTTVHWEVGTGRLHDDLWNEESQRWPGWQAGHRSDASVLHDRNRAEWAAASMVIANSDFARDALIRQGVEARRVVVVPLVADPAPAIVDRSNRSGPLRVLFLGRASLMKGLPDFLEAMRRLDGRAIARVVGSIQISEDAMRSAPATVEWVGAVPRHAVREQLAWADAFAFPTICDSFGLSQIEAMAHGLPVISSTNCADVAEEGVSGYRVPIRDPAALADRIGRLADDRALLARMSEAALARSRTFTEERFYAALMDGMARAAGDEVR